MKSNKVNRCQRAPISPKLRFKDGLVTCRDIVHRSSMFKELCDSLEPYRNTIIRVRCLAIGSFHEDLAARYQIALLQELIDFILGGEQEEMSVSIYDPVFTKDDLDYIHEMGPSWSVDEKAPDWAQGITHNQTLFFLPHAPLDLTEQVLRTEQPNLWLANNVVTHTDRYTKLQLHEKYPVISKLLHSLETEEKTLKTDQPLSKPTESNDEFTTFVSRRKKRANKNKFKEPIIDYDSVTSHFKRCKIITTFREGSFLKNQPWLNSFSDLTLHLIE